MAKRFQVTLSDDLFEAMELMRPILHYRNLSEMVNGAFRYIALTQQPHTLSEVWASLSPAERDLLDARLLAMVKDGKGEKGSALKRMIYETIKFMCGPDAQHPRVDDVMRALALGEVEYRRRQEQKP